MFAAWGLLRDTTNVLLEGAPRDLDVAAIESRLTAEPGVTTVHHLHVWELASDLPALSVHVVLEGEPTLHDAQAEGDRLRSMLAAQFGIEHATLELECHDCEGAASALHALGASPQDGIAVARARTRGGHRVGRPHSARVARRSPRRSAAQRAPTTAMPVPTPSVSATASRSSHAAPVKGSCERVSDVRSARPPASASATPASSASGAAAATPRRTTTTSAATASASPPSEYDAREQPVAGRLRGRAPCADQVDDLGRDHGRRARRTAPVGARPPAEPRRRPRSGTRGQGEPGPR